MFNYKRNRNTERLSERLIVPLSNLFHSIDDHLNDKRLNVVCESSKEDLLIDIKCPFPYSGKISIFQVTKLTEARFKLVFTLSEDPELSTMNSLRP